MKAQAIISLGLVLAVIILSFASAFEYYQSSNLSYELGRANNSLSSVLNHSSTISTEQVTIFNSSEIVFHVSCCIDLPKFFQVGGNYTFHVLEYAPPPPVTRNGTIEEFYGGVLLIFEVTHGETTQNVSFSWTGTFSETVPPPGNATAFNGGVSFAWFVNSMKLYLEIDTKISWFQYLRTG